MFAAVLPIAGCSFVNAIDVCERGAASEHEINRRTEGRQYTGRGQGIAALPSGASLVTFISDAPGAPEQRELRGVVLGQDGAPTRTCESATDDHTFAAPEGDAPAQIFLLPVAIGPPTAEEVGILAYARWAGDGFDVGATGQAELFMQALTPSGCGTGSRRLVSSEAPGTFIADLSVVPLGDGRFLLLWVAFDSTGITSFVRARIGQPDDIVEPWLGTVSPSTGAPNPEGDVVDILPPGPGYLAVSAVRTPTGILVATYRRDLTTSFQHTDVMVLSDRLEVLRPPSRVHSADVALLPEFFGFQLAFDGENGLLVHNERDELGTPRVRVTSLDAAGEVQGKPYFVDAHGVADQERPTVAALPGGGFVIGWEVAGAADDRDRLGTGIVAALLDGRGRLRFANRACGARPFRLNVADAGDQRALTLGVLSDGALLAAWTDEGYNGPDISGASVRGAVWRRDELMPVE